MKTNNPQPDPRWQRLVESARADTTPAIDTTALLRSVRTAAETPATWWSELASLFEIRGAVSGCIAATVLLATISIWQAWQIWEEVGPLAQTIVVNNPPASGSL